MTRTRRYGFGPGLRLAGRRDFQRVFSEGRKLAGRNLILWIWAAGRPAAGPRLGLAVSAKVGGAVLRNRLKRLTREAFRLNSGRFRAGHDLVVYLRPGCRWPGLAAAERDLLELCGKAGVVR